jgi:hypothetical protein
LKELLCERGKGKMKKKRFFIFWMVLSLIFIGLNAQGAMIDDSRNGSDTYWGGTVVNSSPTTYGDVIGYPEFSLDGMTITLNSNTMTVVITGDYFKRQGLAASYGPGDLYIDKNGWSVSGIVPHYYDDIFSISEGWDYVIHLDTNTPSGGVLTGSINEINFGDITMTGAPPGYTYRRDQAWKGGYGNPVSGNVTGSIDSSSITYIFDTTYLGLGSEFGLHWTMECGNDVVEGKVQTPEPATIILLGAGLVGLGAKFRRRKK